MFIVAGLSFLLLSTTQALSSSQEYGLYSSTPSPRTFQFLNQSYTPTNPPSLATNHSALLSPGLNSTGTTAWLKTPGGNTLGVRCIPAYGALDLGDCVSASQYIPDPDDPSSAEESEFRDRSKGLSDQSYPLPMRFLGGECLTARALRPMIPQ